MLTHSSCPASLHWFLPWGTDHFEKKNKKQKKTMLISADVTLRNRVLVQLLASHQLFSFSPAMLHSQLRHTSTMSCLLLDGSRLANWPLIWTYRQDIMTCAAALWIKIALLFPSSHTILHTSTQLFSTVPSSPQHSCNQSKFLSGVWSFLFSYSYKTPIVGMTALCHSAIQARTKRWGG